MRMRWQRSHMQFYLHTELYHLNDKPEPLWTRQAVRSLWARTGSSWTGRRSEAVLRSLCCGAREARSKNVVYTLSSLINITSAEFGCCTVIPCWRPYLFATSFQLAACHYQETKAEHNEEIRARFKVTQFFWLQQVRPMPIENSWWKANLQPLTLLHKVKYHFNVFIIWESLMGYSVKMKILAIIFSIFDKLNLFWKLVWVDNALRTNNTPLWICFPASSREHLDVTR